MNELLTSSLQKLLDLVGQGFDFLAGELPAFAQEIVTYGMMSYIASVVIYTMIFLFMLILGITWIKQDWKDSDGCRVGLILGNVLAWASCIPFFIAVGHVFDLLKTIFAPRLYLIEQLRNLLR